jgi:predicted nuclease of predicted toxin-antitoxin system
MARFKADENLPTVVIGALRDAGHDVRTVQEQGLTGTDDETLARICADEARVVVTLDRGFGDPRRLAKSAKVGVIVLRPATDGPASCLAPVRVLLPALADADLSGALWIVSLDRVRVRRR